MNCSKCGKEIEENDKSICDECEKIILEEIKKEEDGKDDVEKDSDVKTGEKNNKIKIIWISIIAILIILILSIGFYLFFWSNNYEEDNNGNTIANIRNNGFLDESNGWIYYSVLDTDKENMCIYKKNKKSQKSKLILKKKADLLYLNVLGEYIYFVEVEYPEENADISNKICKMKLNGSDLQVINDNEFDDERNEIYIVNDKIYYTGTDLSICSMNLDGSDKKVILQNTLGLLGVNEKYIIYNILKIDEDGRKNIITYKMGLNGEEQKEITGQRLYSINLIGDEIYYVDDMFHVYRKNLNTGETNTILEKETKYINIYDNKIYAMADFDEDDKQSIYKIKLDGTGEKKIIELEQGTGFINVTNNMIMYTDSNDEKRTINIMNLENKNISTIYEEVLNVK